MTKVSRYLLVVCSLLSVWGCFGHEVVPPDSKDQSAIAYAQRMIKEMSTGMDRLISPALTRVQNEGDYRLLVGSAYVTNSRTILDNFTSFCQSLQGSMVGKACRSGPGDEQVKFLVHYSTDSLPPRYATSFQKVTVNLEVYEPVGQPGAKFFQAIKPYGYISQAEREAQEKKHQTDEAARLQIIAALQQQERQKSHPAVSPSSPPASTVSLQPPPPPSLQSQQQPPAPVQAPERRLALVIGNSEYQQVGRLPNPINDAKDIAALLQTLHFQVQLLQNAARRDMEEAIQRFGRSLRSGEVGLLYFAGHGMQIEGQNYLIPTDVMLTSAADVKYKTISMNWVLDTMKEAKNGLNVIIFDACRNNPFPQGQRAGLRGLAVVSTVSGALIAYSTSPEGVAEDGKGRNSPYAKALLRYMKEPGLPIEQMFKQVRIAVQRETNGKQTPWELSSLVGNFSFAVR